MMAIHAQIATDAAKAREGGGARLAIFESMTAENSMLVTLLTTDEKGGK